MIFELREAHIWEGRVKAGAGRSVQLLPSGGLRRGSGERAGVVGLMQCACGCRGLAARPGREEQRAQPWVGPKRSGLMGSWCPLKPGIVGAGSTEGTGCILHLESFYCQEFVANGDSVLGISTS